MSLKSSRTACIISCILFTGAHALVQLDRGEADNITLNGELRVTVGGQLYTLPHAVWAQASYLAIGPGGVYAQSGRVLHLNSDKAVPSEAATLTDYNVWWYSGQSLIKGTFELQTVDSFVVSDVESIGIVKTAYHFWAVGANGCIYGLTADTSWCGNHRPAAWAGSGRSIFLGFATGTVLRLDHGLGVSAFAANVLNGESVPGDTSLSAPVVVANAVVGGESLRKIWVRECNLTVHYDTQSKTMDACMQAEEEEEIQDEPEVLSVHHRVYLHDNLCPDGKYTLYLYGYPAMDYPENERCKDITAECVPVLTGTEKHSSCVTKIVRTPKIGDFGDPCANVPTITSSTTGNVAGPENTPITVPCVDGWWFDGATCYPCNKCTSGQRLARNCTADSPTICADCESGTFVSDEWHLHTVCYIGNGCPGQTIYNNGKCPHTSFQPIHLIWLIIPTYVAAVSFITITGHGLTR